MILRVIIIATNSNNPIIVRYRHNKIIIIKSEPDE